MLESGDRKTVNGKQIGTGAVILTLLLFSECLAQTIPAGVIDLVRAVRDIEVEVIFECFECEEPDDVFDFRIESSSDFGEFVANISNEGLSASQSSRIFDTEVSGIGTANNDDSGFALPNSARSFLLLDFVPTSTNTFELFGNLLGDSHISIEPKGGQPLVDIGEPGAFSETFVLEEAEAYLLIANADGTNTGGNVSSWSFALAFSQPEDFNGDGSVDFSDFVAFSNAFNMPATGDNAVFDLDGSGTVDFGDFVPFSNAFGTHVERAAVPEPATTILSCIGLICLYTCRRKRFVSFFVGRAVPRCRGNLG